MAHLRDLPLCRVCSRPATKQVYTFRNDMEGSYCSRHANAALKAQEAIEQRMFARQRDGEM